LGRGGELGLDWVLELGWVLDWEPGLGWVLAWERD
jgi:hypothetical protein